MVKKTDKKVPEVVSKKETTPKAKAIQKKEPKEQAVKVDKKVTKTVPKSSIDEKVEKKQKAEKKIVSESTKVKETEKEVEKKDVAKKEETQAKLDDDTNKEEKVDEKNLSAFQIKERRQRTVFVGNVPLDAGTKQLAKLFKGVGKVEKVWFRSICVDQENSKAPNRAKIIQQKWGENKDSKNAYVLYENELAA